MLLTGAEDNVLIPFMDKPRNYPMTVVHDLISQLSARIFSFLSNVNQILAEWRNSADRILYCELMAARFVRVHGEIV